MEINKQVIQKQLANALKVAECDIEYLSFAEGIYAFKIHEDWYDFDLTEDGRLIDGSINLLKPVIRPTY